MEIGQEVICKQIILNEGLRPASERQWLVGIIGRIFNFKEDGWAAVGYMELCDYGYVPRVHSFHITEIEPFVNPQTPVERAAEVLTREILKVNVLNYRERNNLTMAWRQWMRELIEYRREDAMGRVIYRVNFYEHEAVIIRQKEGLAAYRPRELEEAGRIMGWLND
jgi:hypothetical protein